MSDQKTITLESRASSLQELEDAVDEFGTEQDWAPKLLFQLKLALEEVVLNVINHGYGEEGHSVNIAIKSTADTVTIVVSDTARPYNPLVEAPMPDLESTLEERAVGGLGVHMVRSIADDVSYARKGDTNCLTIVKRKHE